MVRLVAMLLMIFLFVPGSALAEQDDATGISEIPAEIRGDGDGSSPWGLNYYGIFYGPSLGNPDSYQPTPRGEADKNKPLLLKNWASLSYSLNKDVAISGAAYWHYQPVLGHQLKMKDPYARISHNSLMSGNRWNLYADLRMHFPVTMESRTNDLLAGVQTFQALTYDIPGTSLTLGSYTSVRYNVFGRRGFGNDVELYFSPNLFYQVSSTVALTLMYEMNGTHVFGAKPFNFENDGTDLEPGVNWQISPRLNVNPYLHFYPGDKLNLNSTSFGMMLTWTLL